MFVIKKVCLYPDVLCYCCLIDVFSAMEIVKLTKQSRIIFFSMRCRQAHILGHIDKVAIKQNSSKETSDKTRKTENMTTKSST